MRPLKLVFEGINSFEKRQTIDFKLLTEAHLFGIFGPTGAGKSTILDAITLALYGSVVRAPNNTGGILNTRCDTLYVELEFLLGAGDGERVYKVMRSYARDKSDDGEGDTLKVKKCSLQRIEPEAAITLCAEKSSEVTKRIIQLLGLNMEDFIHSVVLPQGQFAEFLNMTGKKRRDMLERLFHLEEFGKQLTERVKAREDALQSAVNANAAALNEIGEVSAEQLKSAKIKRELDRDELKRTEEQSSVADKEAEGLRALYNLSQERKNWQVRKLEHDAARSRISLLSAELDAAKRAETVLPIGAQLADLERERAELEKSCREKTMALHSATSLCEKTSKSCEERSTQLSSERQKLQSMAGALEAILPRQEEMARLSADEKVLLSELGELERASEGNDAALKEKETAIETGKKFLKEQQKLAKLGAKIDLEKLSRGADIEKTLDELQKRYGDALGKLSATEAEIGQKDEALELARQAEQDALRELNEAKEASRRADIEYIEASTRNAAARLARQLEEGKPCPVCGAVHHPELALETDMVEDNREKARSRREAAQATYSTKLQDVARLAQARETLDDAQKEQTQLAESLRGELTASTVEWENLRQETNAGSLRAAYAEALENQNRSANAQRLIDQARQKLDRYQQQLGDYRMEQLKLHSRVDAIKEKIEANKRAAGSWAVELGRLNLALDINIGDKLEDCRAKLAHVENDFARIDRTLKECQQRRDDAEKRSIEFNTRFKHVSEQCVAQGELLAAKLKECAFASLDEARMVKRSAQRMDELTRAIRSDADEQLLIDANLKRLAETAQGREVSEGELSEVSGRANELRERMKQLNTSLGSLESQISDMSARLKRKAELETSAARLNKALDDVVELKQVLRGGALVEYVANQYLIDITRMAGERLMFLTGNRYNLELSGEGFIVRDMEKGGVARATTSLSGGETFLVSLALALSLSLHINLRGQPLGFFFLDEGFGTLDDRLLSTVMDALSMLARENYAIGVISHVSAMKERIPAQLIVTSDTEGSHARVEFA